VPIIRNASSPAFVLALPLIEILKDRPDFFRRFVQREMHGEISCPNCFAAFLVGDDLSPQANPGVAEYIDVMHFRRCRRPAARLGTQRRRTHRHCQ
jgi:hypothetical protein